MRSRLFAAGASSLQGTYSTAGTTHDVAGHTQEANETETDPNLQDLALLNLGDNFNIPFPETRRTSRRANDIDRTTLANNPLEILLRHSYLPLPHIVKQTLSDTRHDWHTLGGSRCSYNRHLLVLKTDKRSNEEVASLPLQHPDEKDESTSKVASIFNYSLKRLGAATHSLATLAIHSTVNIEDYIEKTLSNEIGSLRKSEPETHQCRPPIDNNHTKMSPAQNDDFPPPSANIHDDEHGAAGKPIPEAVLVYHESAHSIVFRDHLRRQLSAIRRTSTAMENSSHSTHSVSQLYERHRNAGHSAHGIRSEHDGSSSHPKGRHRHNTLAIHSEESSVADTDGNGDIEVPYNDDTEGGYKPSDSSDVGYESASSRGSYSSLDKSDHSKRHSNHRNFRKKMGAEIKPTMQAVAVANFQPVIEPLEKLELNSSDVFQPLLDADPMKDLEATNGRRSLSMTDAEWEGEIVMRDTE